jgi:hypothetical protein
MTLERMTDLFSKHSDEEYIEFERVKKRRSNRPDLHAFMLLDEILPGKKDIVGAAEHDQVFLSIDCRELAKVITEEQIIELLRCGVGYGDYDCLSLNV